jgi:hypothetical protein
LTLRQRISAIASRLPLRYNCANFSSMLNPQRAVQRANHASDALPTEFELQRRMRSMSVLKFIQQF